MGVSEDICVYIAIGGRNNNDVLSRLCVPAEICVYIAIRRVRMRAVAKVPKHFSPATIFPLCRTLS